MSRMLIVLLMLCAFAVQVSAQTPPAQVGDPPVLSRIEVLPPDRFGLVTITGSSGAVFPNAYITIRNLYTGETAYTRAGITGIFTAQIAGTLDTPFWISPSGLDTPRDLRDHPGSIPGGPGAILYPAAADLDPTPEAITRIALDGKLDDWALYTDAVQVEVDGGRILALRNSESLYLAIEDMEALRATANIEIALTIDTFVYSLRFNPSLDATAAVRQISPNQRDLGVTPIASVMQGALEMRIPLHFTERADVVTLNDVRWLDETGTLTTVDAVGQLLNPIAEQDGIVRAESALSAGDPSFAVGGTPVLDEGDEPAAWLAHGRMSSAAIEAGEIWKTEIDVTLAGVDPPADARILTELLLLPIAQLRDDPVVASNEAIATAISTASTNNGWSHRLTPSGLPIDGQSTLIAFDTSEALASDIVRREEVTLFPLDFSAAIPRGLPAGLYVPVLHGRILSFEGEQRWDQPDAVLLTRLPVVLSVGGIDQARLPMALFVDDASDGSRGVLPIGEEAALSNRVRTNSATLILPPYTNTVPRQAISYALEPYLPNLMPNSVDQNSTPLIPFALPGGGWTGSVRHPSGRVDNLGTAPFQQNRLSTPQVDETALFGEASPVDMFRLTTLEPRFTEYTFDEYGEYRITLNASLQDVWGNTYTGGGEYSVLVAEQFDMTPGALPGTPFTVGDAVNAGLRVAPAFPADVSVTIRFYPLDGSPVVEQRLTGRSNRSGHFFPREAPMTFEQPGEYVIDYEARYRAADGSLWAGSLRSAGVVAPRVSALQARGQRGALVVTDGTAAGYEPAWFDLARYAEANELDADELLLPFPYNSGDVAWLPDGVDGDMRPGLTLFDHDGSYTAALRGLASVGDLGDPAQVEQQIARQEMPIVPDTSYAYISAVRPNATVRQFISVSGREPLGTLETDWHNDDPLNRQIGAGIDGVLPDDLILLFGGVIVRTPGGEPAAAGYASAAVVIDPDSDPGERIYPPGRGRDGGGDGGALLIYRDIEYDAVIVPTGLQPGDVLDAGDAFGFTGQVVPTLPMVVRVTYTRPSGQTFTIESQASPFGYFYHPADQQIANEPGVWSAQVDLIYEGRTSVGMIAQPGLRGGIAGLTDGRFDFYVLPPNSEPLPWNSALTDSVIAIGLPYNFNFTLPEGWTDIKATFTMTTPGYVLQSEALRVNGRSFSYQYAAPALGRDISILETETRTGGNWVSDVRTLTFVASGRNENGELILRTRTFTLLHDRLVTYR
ncbi:MAG: hypothetical protein IPK19_25410 [Chloroflexi bacterium]|nr:hypothetical protein [Chloroflexota bacterium]